MGTCYFLEIIPIEVSYFNQSWEITTHIMKTTRVYFIVGNLVVILLRSCMFIWCVRGALCSTWIYSLTLISTFSLLQNVFLVVIYFIDDSSIVTTFSLEIVSNGICLGLARSHLLSLIGFGEGTFIKDLEKRGMCRTEEEKGGDEKGRVRNAGK